MKISTFRLVASGPIVFVLAFFAISLLFAAPIEEKPSTPPSEVSLEYSNATSWQRPRTRDREEERLEMVAEQIVARGVSDASVLAAMRNTPRHWFLPKPQIRNAYLDRPLQIGKGQTISQPFIVALMTEHLKIREGDKILEVGTGSGYQAAVLSEITPEVFTIEIVKTLAERSARTFKLYGYETIRTRHGDGYQGWPEEAPFDAIIVTCAPTSIPEPLLEQLAAGGRMCIPVGERLATQELVLVEKREDGTLKRETVDLVRFVPMTGEAAEED